MPTTHYIWDELNDTYLMETDATGATSAVYTNEPVHYGNLISQRRSNATNYYHFDAQHSTRQLTDANQNVTDTRGYSSFGELTQSAGATVFPFQYGGKKGSYTDQETGLISVRRRDYRPKVARWMSRDPLLLHVNGFWYAENDPVNRIDPTGLLSIPGVGPPTIKRCGGFEYSHAVFADKNYKTNLYLVQYVCLKLEIDECQLECTCNVKKSRKYDWCCFFEIFTASSKLEGERPKGFPTDDRPVWVDVNGTPALSQGECSSKGKFLGVGEVRLFEAKTIDDWLNKLHAQNALPFADITCPWGIHIEGVNAEKTRFNIPDPGGNPWPGGNPKNPHDLPWGQYIKGELGHYENSLTWNCCPGKRHIFYFASIGSRSFYRRWDTADYEPEK